MRREYMDGNRKGKNRREENHERNMKMRKVGEKQEENYIENIIS